MSPDLRSVPSGWSPEICSRFILLNLKDGPSFRHLKQYRNVFQINMQRLESFRQRGKKMGHLSFEETGLLMMVPFCICMEQAILWGQHIRDD